MNIKPTILCSLVMAISGLSFADGGFFSKAQSLYPPSIPTQRATISHRSGIETLVVESALSGQAGEYAWVIPLPNEPLRVEKASSRMYDTLSFRLFPKIEGTPKYPTYVFWFGALTILLMTVSAYHRYKSDNFRASRYLCEVLGVICCCFILNSITGKVLSGYRGDEAKTAAGAVTLFSQGSVGSYNYVVAASTDSSKLIDWLNENQYYVPQKAKEVLQNYIRKGWKFFAAKLKSEPGQSPHPVMLQFKSKELVYPMALTATMHPPLNLDLYVVSDRIAFAKNTITYAAEQISPRAILNDNRFGRRREDTEETPAWLYDLFYPNCVISRLSGNYQHKIPANDFLFTFKSYQGEYRTTLFSTEAAKQNATAYSLILFSALLTIIGAFAIDRKVNPYKVWAAAAILAVLCSGFGYWKYSATQLQPYESDSYSRY